MDEKSGKKSRPREPEPQAASTPASDAPQRDPAMQLTREVRIGLGVVAALLLVFGYVFVSKINNADGTRVAFVPPDDASSRPEKRSAPIAPTVVGGDESPRHSSQPPEEPFASRYPPRQSDPQDEGPRTGASFLPSRSAVATEVAETEAEIEPKSDAASIHDRPRINAVPEQPEPSVAETRSGGRYESAAEPTAEIKPSEPRRDPPASKREYGGEIASKTSIPRAPQSPDSPADRAPPAAAKAIAENSAGPKLVERNAVERNAIERNTADSFPRNHGARAASEADHETHREPDATSAPSHDEAPRVRTRVYTVRANETVYDIARRELGGVARWKEIVALNRAVLGDDIDALRAGMKLHIPDQRNGASVARTRDELPWR